MAYIKQIKLKSTDTPYDIWAIADADGNTISTTYTKKDQAIPYIVGSDTDETPGTWTGSCSAITEYVEGLTIIYVPKVNNAENTTLKINNLAAVPCSIAASTNIEENYYSGSPILFTYLDDMWVSWESNIVEILEDTILEQANAINETLADMNDVVVGLDSRLGEVEQNPMLAITPMQISDEIDQKIGIASEELTESIPEVVLDNLNTNGLTIQKDDSSVKTTIGENGLTVQNADDSLIAEFTNENAKINNLEVTGTFILVHHKVESVQNTEYDGTLTDGTGFFYNG